MDPSDVDSADDVRTGWDGWSYSERLAALDSLANSTLALYGYDDVDVASGEEPDNHTGYYLDDEIVIDPEVLANPDPEQAIHVTDHETVHAMDDQDGIDDSSYEDDDDFDFTEEDLESFSHHQEVGDTARALDYDGVSSDSGGGGGGGGGGGTGGSEYEGGGEGVQADDLSVDIDWASGVWVDTTGADGSYSVDIYFTPMEGW